MLKTVSKVIKDFSNWTIQNGFAESPDFIPSDFGVANFAQFNKLILDFDDDSKGKVGKGANIRKIEVSTDSGISWAEIDKDNPDLSWLDISNQKIRFRITLTNLWQVNHIGRAKLNSLEIQVKGFIPDTISMNGGLN